VGDIEDKTQMIIILVIVFAVTIVCISLLFLIMKLVRDTNKEIITRLGAKLDIKGVKFETGLEIDVSEKGEKEKQ
jgi:hypothetical protein